jgi:hypothetical protein
MRENQGSLSAILSDLGFSAQFVDEAVEAVHIRSEGLQEAYEEYTGVLALWIARAADAVADHVTAKAVREDKWASTYLDFREHQVDSSGKRYTETALAALVDTDLSYKAALKAEADAAHIARIVGGIAEAVRAKKDMLVGLGANYRAEMGADLTIRNR